jgi:hypothetical protein
MLAALALKFWKPLAGAVAVLAVIAAFEIWLASHNTALLRNYVTIAELAATKAKLTEIQRQAAVATVTVDRVNQQIFVAKAAEAIAIADREKGIASYEKRLKDAKRACLFDDSDVDRILRHR